MNKTKGEIERIAELVGDAMGYEGSIAFLRALRVFAVNHSFGALCISAVNYSVYADRVERMRFQPVGAAPSGSRV